jgi:glycosyltransferase involved in cell wall biosynthesis
MTAQSPIISVIMPVYNGAQFIRETIDSVLKQTYQNFEFIIVNDGSTDNTQQIVESYHDTSIILTTLARNAGVSNARNIGIGLARGEYIAFCDADDIYNEDRLQAQYDFLKSNPLIDVSGSAIIFFENEQEKLIASPESDTEIKDFFLRGNPIAQPTVMGKSSIFKKYKYNTELQASEDYDLWTRMAIAGVVFGNLPLALVKYRAHEAQASKTKGKLLDATYKATYTKYAVAYLNNSKLSVYTEANEITLADFKQFIEELSKSTAAKEKNLNTFRPLIALQYKKLSKHGISAFITFTLIAAKYHLDFPGKYLLNIFLLSLISLNRESSLFNTLSKLKI